MKAAMQHAGWGKKRIHSAEKLRQLKEKMRTAVGMMQEVMNELFE